MRRRIGVLFLGLVLALGVHAQMVLKKVVVSSGGGPLQSADQSVQMKLTVGQAVAGPQMIKGGEYRMQTGYWGPAADPDLVFRNSVE